MSQLTLQLPDPVLEAARKVAERHRLSVEEYISNVLAQAVSQDEAWEQRVARGKNISRERIKEILVKAPDVPSIPGDEMPE